MTHTETIARDYERQFAPDPPAQACIRCEWSGDWLDAWHPLRNPTASHCPWCGWRTVEERHRVAA